MLIRLFLNEGLFEELFDFAACIGNRHSQTAADPAQRYAFAVGQMLLGFIDQAFASNFAYKDVPGKIYPEGLLKDKSAVCISTMKGPANYTLFTLGNAHKILMKRAVFQFVGIRKVKFFEFGSMESPKGNQAEKLAKVQNYFEK